MGLSDFFKRRESYQVSEFLLNHPLKDKYFYRLMRFSGLDEKAVVAYDSKRPRVITFDPWPQTIFLAASGLKTTLEFTVEMAKMYQGEVPALLEPTIIEETEKLIAEEIIAMSEQKVFLGDDFRYPIKNKKDL